MVAARMLLMFYTFTYSAALLMLVWKGALIALLVWPYHHG